MKPVDYTKAIQLELFSNAEEAQTLLTEEPRAPAERQVIDLKTWRDRRAQVEVGSVTEKVLALLAL